MKTNQEKIREFQSECEKSVSSEYVTEGDDYLLLLDGQQTQDKIDKLTKTTILQQEIIQELMERISVIENELLIGYHHSRLELIERRLDNIEPSKDYG